MKIQEMSVIIEQLRSAAATLTDAADWLAIQFSETEDAPPEPTPKPALTLEEVRAILARKSRAGHSVEVRALLQRYGATKLSQVEPEDYEALLREAEVLDDG
ncbi:MAG: DNA ligase [Clostridiales bacterium]|nr:DNA ligase [Clostridiales bacterium]